MRTLPLSILYDFREVIGWAASAQGLEKMETVRDFIFMGSKITVDGDCSHEIKRYLLLGRKAMTNLGRILKSRDVTWLTKVHIVNVQVGP